MYSFVPVGFLLTTKSGDIEGGEFAFEDGGEAHIGRTDDNDVVVCDTEVSRNHARVFEADGGCFIEDLGSINGTFVNGEALSAQEPFLLKAGDVISIGSGELVFWDQSTELTGKSAPREDKTVIKPIEEVKAERPSALAVSPRKSLPSVFEAKAPLAKRKKPSSSLPPLSAAERAREQREMQRSLLGRFRYAFAALEPQKRRVAVTGMALAALIVLLGIAFLISREGNGGEMGPEPKRLEVNGTPVEDSFGWGQGVQWPNLNAKQFDFHVVSPGRMVAIVRYYARDISSEEVEIRVNGRELGFIPADRVDEQANELVVPPQLIVNDENNRLQFNNVRNPRAKEDWRIWGISIKIEVIPNFASTEEARAAIASARQAAQQFYDARKIAPVNLYESWRAYRKAWLFAESLDDQDALEYEFLLSKYREARRELDDLCNRYTLEFQKALNEKQPFERLAGILEELLRYFGPEHHCHQRAQKALGRTF